MSSGPQTIPKEWIDSPSRELAITLNNGDTAVSYKVYEDVDRTIPWSDPAVVFTPIQFAIDTSAEFDKVLFMYIPRAAGDPLIYVYRIIVC